MRDSVVLTLVWSLASLGFWYIVFRALGVL